MPKEVRRVALAPIEGIPPFRRVPFTQAHASVEEIAAVVAALKSDKHAGNGPWTETCQQMIEMLVPRSRALITQSCTAALEMIALLINISPGDEIIMPSWTFASTANAIVLRGGVPVFVDVDPDTLNIDVDAAEAAMTPRTRAILCVHYAGVACKMDRLLDLCSAKKIYLIEDAAQAVGANWRGQPLGGIGAFGAYSFHATKNISSGEGGALLINDLAYVRAAEMIWEKGTDRLQYLRGEVTNYEWAVAGSSYLPSEMTAAFLHASLSSVAAKTRRRLNAWDYYDRSSRNRKLDRWITLPAIPLDAQHNGHIFHFRHKRANDLKFAMEQDGISITTHYRPLHMSKGGKKYGRQHGCTDVTEKAAATLLRLPLFEGISRSDQEYVMDRLQYWLEELA